MLLSASDCLITPHQQIVKTPGGELIYQYLKKCGTAPKCGDCHLKLLGVHFIVHLRTPSDFLTCKCIVFGH